MPGQPETVKAAGTFAVLSPFWSVSVAVAVPDGVWHVERKSPSGPPSRFTPRLVNGMSGSPVNVAAFLARSTAPVRVSGKGEGNTRVSDSPLDEPVRYAVPVRADGYSGEVAVAEPTVAHVPEARLRHSARIDSRLGPSVACGKARDTERLGA